MKDTAGNADRCSVDYFDEIKDPSIGAQCGKSRIL